MTIVWDGEDPTEWTAIVGQHNEVALAILGDFVPMGVGQALGIQGGGNSLDNTVRFGHITPTDWILCDIRIEAKSVSFVRASGGVSITDLAAITAPTVVAGALALVAGLGAGLASRRRAPVQGVA